MTDRNRTQDQRDQQLSSQTPRDDQPSDIEGTESSDRPRRDDASVADDRGVDRDRRSFNGDREHDELGSEMEEDSYDDAESELDESDRSER